jgi:Ni-sirohydrochlorin a,c-diamide synthase
MLGSIQRAHEKGLPIYAECGGLMYLAREIEWEGQHDMVGLVPGKVRKGQTRVVSYINGELTRDCLLGPTGSHLLGHEFHHSELVMDEKEKEKVEYAIRLDRGTGIQGGQDGIVENNMVASYSHLHAASYRHFPSEFLKTCTRAK